MYQPDFWNLVDWYKYVADNFAVEAVNAFEQAPVVTAEFNWLDKTEQAFEHIVEKFDNGTGR
jgi:hypothetical protein